MNNQLGIKMRKYDDYLVRYDKDTLMWMKLFGLITVAFASISVGIKGAVVVLCLTYPILYRSLDKYNISIAISGDLFIIQKFPKPLTYPLNSLHRIEVDKTFYIYFKDESKGVDDGVEISIGSWRFNDVIDFVKKYSPDISIIDLREVT